ncbi:esterase E4-like [Athalia rosae]|uniref:esterase E4-like n=1 Tax=Athalia rosae TaxID=37344 RepID=UPI002033308B|nr:esterase E4-like [Athalia rosae]XP_048505708.1 esterase E4-like [Athalia rosae]
MRSQISRNYFVVVYLLSISFVTSEIKSHNDPDASDRIAGRPKLTIRQGTLEGIILVTRQNRSISAFLGIPYAKPPIEHLRFESPLAADAWNETLDASTDPNVCPQLSGDKFIGDEDCLYLNVYTPEIDSVRRSSLLPVMVFIHGGGFERGNGGSAAFSPKYLLDQNIVLITPNYRLGVLGFLSTGDKYAPGNYGLKDMTLALKWVQQNVAEFGGDPEKVTICGQSTGAGTVELLTLSKSTKGLFRSYITTSGSAFSIRSFRPIATYVKRANQLGTFLGCPTGSSVLLIRCLKKLDASTIVNTKHLFYVWEQFPDIIWGPTVEPNIEGSFLVDTPENLYATGQIRDLPWITSVVRDEGLILTAKFYENQKLFEYFLDNSEELMPHILQYHDCVDDEKAYTEALKAYYLNDLTAERSLLLSNFTKLVSDHMYIFPGYNALRQRFRWATSSEYFYNFHYRGVYSYTYKFTGGSTENIGVAHSDDLVYLFPIAETELAKFGKEMSAMDYKMVDIMVKLWTSFARDGTPSITNPHATGYWRPYSRDDNYLLIGNNSDLVVEMQHSFLPERMQFWNRLQTTSKKNTLTDSTPRRLSFLQNIYGYIERFVKTIYILCYDLS